MTAYVYILANRPRGVLYVGSTTSIVDRIGQHKMGQGAFFTKKYNVTNLVYMEEHTSILDARERECRLKRWKRQWKFELVESINPEWKCLFNLSGGM